MRKNLFVPGLQSLLLILVILLTAACTQGTDTQTVPESKADFTIVFMGDTHSHLDPGDYVIKVNGKDTLVSMGGLTRLAYAVKSIGSKDDIILLHGGDVLFGTYYFIRYGVDADAAMLNSMAFDAVTIGNHDFDNGPQGLADLISKSKIPFISANIDVSKSAELNSTFNPYIVFTRNGHKLGVIGLTATETPLLDPSGPNVRFTNPAEAVNKYVSELAGQGISNIVLLSHLGYEKDLQLVKSTTGIDLVIGAHSHTLLGTASLKEMGLPVEGPFPVLVQNAEGRDVPVVHAWEYARSIGVVKASFDKSGRLLSCSGNPIIVTGDDFRQADAQGNYIILAGDSAGYKEAINTIVSHAPEIGLYPEDDLVKKVRDVFYQPVSFLGEKVAATETTLIDRDLAPLLADALMWKAGRLGLDAQFAFVPVSYMRNGILMKGDFTAGAVYEFMPFNSPLVVCEVTCESLKGLIETMVNNPNPYIVVKSGTPYLAVSGLAFNVDSSKPRRVTDLKVKIDGNYVPLKPDGTYTVVTTERISKGMFKVKQTVEARDSDVFIEYARYLKNIRPVEEKRIIGW